jgi:predicted nucleic acid-binding protein
VLLLDANVIIYSEGREHRYRSSCRIIVHQARQNSSAYCINTETFQEVMHYYARRGERARGVGVAEDLLSMFPTVIPITIAEIREAMRLMSETSDLTARDAIHAAVVLEHSLEGIISADQDFDRVPSLRRFDPIELTSG